MAKELETAGEMATAEVSGGFDHYKETVYNLLGTFFTWLSSHQGLALIIILCVLGIMIYLILRFRKYRKQFEIKFPAKTSKLVKKTRLLKNKKTNLTFCKKNYLTSRAS
jgi:uncharacterized membrane protein